MKYQPKPPPPRNIPDATTPQDTPISGSPDTSNDIDMGEEESPDWVYDTYVRDLIGPRYQGSIEPKDSTTETEDLGRDEKVGYLVIRSEDEQAWEEYLFDEEDSEGHYDDEAEDSNGK